MCVLFFLLLGQLLMSMQSVAAHTSATITNTCEDLFAFSAPFSPVEAPAVQASSLELHGLGPRPLFLRTQLLCGEPVGVYEFKGLWCRVRAREQAVVDAKGVRGCHGWVKRSSLKFLKKSYAPNAAIACMKASVFESPQDQSKKIQSLFYATRVAARKVNKRWSRVVFGGGKVGFIKTRALSFYRRFISLDRKKLIHELEGFLNVPYVWGGRSPVGIDCSALVCLLYQVQGLLLPRFAHGQFLQTEDVSPASAQPGDLVFFCSLTEHGFKASHVMIIAGGDHLIEAYGVQGYFKVRRISFVDRLGSSRIALKNGQEVKPGRYIFFRRIE